MATLEQEHAQLLAALKAVVEYWTPHKDYARAFSIWINACQVIKNVEKRK